MEEESTGELNCCGALRLKDDLYLLPRTMGLNVQCLQSPNFLGKSSAEEASFLP